MQAVTVLEVADAHQLCHVAVRYVIHPLHIVHELIAVLHYHQFVAPNQAFFLVLYLCADAQIVAYRPLVRAAEYYGIVLPIVGIGRGNGFYKVTPSYALNVGMAVQVEFQARESVVIRFREPYHFAQRGRVAKYPRLGSLAHHGGEARIAHSPECIHEVAA